MEVQEITRPMGKTINSETQTAVKEESLSSSMGSIYCITSPSGKQYIGQTRHSLDHRFKQHKKSWNKCTALKNAFNKYGTDNMTIKELEKCTFDKLDEREIYYIDTMRTYAPNGYNLTLGGITGCKLYMPFNDLCIIVRSLKLKNRQHYFDWQKEQNIYTNIPADARSVYENKGWVNWPHFLGNNNKQFGKGDWFSFEEALKLIRNMNFKGTKELEKYLSSDKKHPKIPAHPDRSYKDDGWISFVHFIGKGEEKRGKSGWRDFILAREFVHSLGFTREWQWNEYCKSSNIPDDIPKTPRVVYKNAGFIDMGDWIGSGRKCTRDRQWFSYEKAQKIVIKFEFSNTRKYVEWHQETSPLNIPVCPYKIYKNKGWKDWTHYLGENRIPKKRKSKMRSFEKARTYARSLGIKSGNQWQIKYWKTHKKPGDIPLHPERIYAEWKGWKDFLGN